ncbi:MAG: restriction endonuclease subunit S, partial [Hydrogenophaga sp.]|nr:restriction endonuclease subunit S [Hydrogenophaga sp.]
MSELPNGWEAATLEDVAKWSSGGTPSRSNPSYYAGTIPWLKTGELGPLVVFQTEEHISEDAVAASSAKVFPKGSVAVAMYGATIGKTSILGVDAATNQACAVGIPDGSKSKFLYYFLVSQSEAFANAGKGGAQPNISQGIVKSWAISVPPFKEQGRIVAKLEELLSDLDAGVAELKAAKKKLAQYRQSLLKAAVEGALTAEWRAKNPATETGAQLLARILTERRARWEAKQLAKFKEQGKAPSKDWQKKYPEPVQPDTTGLPELPQGWVWASGEQLCEFITKGTTPPKDLNSGGQKSIPFLRVTNLTDLGELDLADEVFVSVETHQGFLARSAVYPNDVLMNIVGPPLGQVAVVPTTFPEWNINQAIAIFRAVEGVLPWFICRYLLSPVAQRWLKARSKTTAGQTNLTLEVC